MFNENSGKLNISFHNINAIFLLLIVPLLNSSLRILFVSSSLIPMDSETSTILQGLLRKSSIASSKIDLCERHITFLPIVPKDLREFIINELHGFHCRALYKNFQMVVYKESLVESNQDSLKWLSIGSENVFPMYL